MGYFNIFYKITRIIDMLTRKRNRKFIVAILVIIVIIFLLHNKGYCAQSDSTYTTDTSYLILSEYNDIVQRFVLSFNKFYGTDTTYTNRCNEFFQLLRDGKYCYLYNDIDGGRIYIGTYTYNSNYTIGDGDLQYNTYLNVPSSYYHVSVDFKQYLIDDRNYLGEIGVSNAYRDIPQILFMKTPKDIIDCMIKAGYGYTNNQDIIDIKTQMNQIKSKIDGTNERLDDLNDNITSTDYDENDVNVDTSAVDSMSDTEVNGLFTTIVSNFNNSLSTWNGTTSIIFYIPFTNGKYISIPDNIVSSKLPTQFLDLVHAFWYFVFGLYLFRFINNLIKKIRSGDILNGYSNDNEVITSNML